jgi:thiol-disulfide isomerase/thioredoxin
MIYIEMSSQSGKDIITSLNPGELQELQQKLAGLVLVVKFGAEWCGPCKRIQPLLHFWMNQSRANIICADLDVDDNIDLYMALKRHKMIGSIPAILAFHGDKARDPKQWYIPDDSVIGSDEGPLKMFLDRCTIKADAVGGTAGVKPL